MIEPDWLSYATFAELFQARLAHQGTWTPDRAGFEALAGAVNRLGRTTGVRGAVSYKTLENWWKGQNPPSPGKKGQVESLRHILQIPDDDSPLAQAWKKLRDEGFDLSGKPGKKVPLSSKTSIHDTQAPTAESSQEEAEREESEQAEAEAEAPVRRLQADELREIVKKLDYSSVSLAPAETGLERQTSAGDDDHNLSNLSPPPSQESIQPTTPTPDSDNMIIPGNHDAVSKEDTVTAAILSMGRDDLEHVSSAVKQAVAKAGADASLAVITRIALAFLRDKSVFDNQPSTSDNTNVDNNIGITKKIAVLLIMTEDAVLGFSTKSLISRGYYVISLSSAQMADQLPFDVLESIGLAIIDYDMPDISGSKLQQHLSSRGMRARVILTVYQSEQAEAFRSINNQHIDFLVKPFTLTDLAARVASIIPSPTDIVRVSSIDQLDHAISKIVRGEAICKVLCQGHLAHQVTETYTYLERVDKELVADLKLTVRQVFSSILGTSSSSADELRRYPAITLCREFRKWGFVLTNDASGVVLKHSSEDGRPYYYRWRSTGGAPGGGHRPEKVYGDPKKTRFYR